MEIIFTEFFFACVLAETHKKVATIIFYFAMAVSHATVERDCLCFFWSALAPRPPINCCNLNTVAGKLTTPEAGTQKVGGKIRISGRIRTLHSKSDFRGQNCLFGLLFLKT
jgi:hypothetical protein